MSNKASFTSEEWATLRDTPHIVGLAVATAGSSGIFGTVAEMFSAGKFVANASNSGNELIKALIDSDELKASQDTIKNAAQAQGPATIAEWLKEQAIDESRKAVAILAVKAAPGEKDAYVKFVADMANSVANAAKEGGFLGFGGERVSEKEREILAAVNSALGVAATSAGAA